MTMTTSIPVITMRITIMTMTTVITRTMTTSITVQEAKLWDASALIAQHGRATRWEAPNSDDVFGQKLQ